MTPKQRMSCLAILSRAERDYGKSLNIHALFKLNDGPMSQDLVQDTFLKTWMYLARGGKIEIMKAFLYHILNNLIIDEYRKRKHRTTSLDVLLDKGFEPANDSTENMYSMLDSKAALLMIHRLPISYHKIMRMKHIQDLNLQEISLITGQTKNAIAVQLHRGLSKLKTMYQK